MDDVPLDIRETDHAEDRTAAPREEDGLNTPSVLIPWLRAQAVNVTRHAAALRPFRREEFGTGDVAPSEGHIRAVNRLLGSLRRSLLNLAAHVTNAAETASRDPTSAKLQSTVSRKEHAHRMVEAIERVWDF